MTYGPRNHTNPIYRTWQNMKNRCLRPNVPAYPRYGGRGITVCEAWMDFDRFCSDMGPRPDRGTIERIDNDGNYEPGNCRWATHTEQANNTRGSRPITVRGQTDTVANWARRTGIAYSALLYRIQQGMGPEAAVYTPAGDAGFARLTHKGKTLKVSEWADETGLPVLTIHKRMRAGWTAAKILDTPSRIGRGNDSLTIDGKTKTVDEWIVSVGMSGRTFRRRRQGGLEPREIIERALRAPKS